MQAGAETRHHAELLPVGIRLLRNGVGDREKALDATSARHPLVERPGDDDLVADIGMNLAAMGDDRGIDVVEEAGEKILHAQFAHRLGERGGACEIEKHQHARFPHREAISTERDVEQHAAADQPCQFEGCTDEQRREEHQRKDPGKCVNQPLRLDPLSIKRRLQTQYGHRDDKRHGRGTHREIRQQRPPGDPFAPARREIEMNAPAGQRHTHPVKTASQIIRHRGFDRRVGEIAIGHPPKQAAQGDDYRRSYRAPHVSSAAAVAMNAASASRSAGGMVRPSLERRHRISSGKRAHSFVHEIAHFGAGQFRPEGGAEVAAVFGVAQDRLDVRAIGGDQAPGLILAEKPPALARLVDLVLEPAQAKSPPGSGVFAVQRGDIG